MDSIVTRQAAPEEVADFAQPLCPINWAVEKDGNVAALFQAQEDDDGWLLVHANAKRRTIHPAVLGQIAKDFSDRLLELEAIGLRAQIAAKNRAAIRLAKKAGYVQQRVDGDGFVILERTR